MPSSKNYVRDYKQEARTSKARGEIGGSDAPNSKRKRLRRLALKKGMVKTGDGKDLDHKVPLSKGGANTLKNARVVEPSKNRSYPRTRTGAIKGGMKK